MTIFEVGKTYIIHPERLRKVEELNLRQGRVKELQGSRLKHRRSNNPGRKQMSPNYDKLPVAEQSLRVIK